MLDLGRATGQAERETLPRAREVRRCFGIALNVYISGAEGEDFVSDGADQFVKPRRSRTTANYRTYIHINTIAFVTIEGKMKIIT